MKMSLIVLVLASLASPAAAAVLRVPSQHTTIQAALNAARSGDTVLVAAGTYAERITWPSTDGIRLVSEQGFAVTTIDAKQAGRVITFATGLSRKTILEGFTITGGLMTVQRNHGPGLYIPSSPTIRSNRITGNIGDNSTAWNYGGGIHVTSSGNPLIERNVVDTNTLRNGYWNYGAGIYVAQAATIVGNQILGNHNDLGQRGYGAGIFVAGSSSTIASNVIVSNVIAGNRNSSTIWNYGGGIRVYNNASALIANNTIADNVCAPGSNSVYGGGIEYSGTSTGQIVNNIIARNTARTGGGVRVASGSTPTVDYNVVWNNSGGDFSGISAGPNGFSANPLFQATTSYRLLVNSPCIDVGLNGAQGGTPFDYEGDPRRLDGDLDGFGGNGTRIDIGADEVSLVGLAATNAPQIGSLFELTMNGPNGGAWILLASPGTGNALLPLFGNALIAPPIFTLGSGVIPGSVKIRIPNVPALAGATLYSQGVVTWIQSSRTVGQMTNRATITLF